MNTRFTNFGKFFLYNFSQVMLQKNAFTGLLFLLGIGLSSLEMLLGSILAVLSALLVAKLCKYDLSTLQSGLYGFNAALVGIAVFYFLPVSFTSLAFIACGGAFSLLLMHFMMSRLASIPTLTAPFILTTWLILVVIDYLGLNTIEPSYIHIPNQITVVDYFIATLRGIAQVMLQDSWLCGAIFFFAIALNSIKTAVWAFTGAAIAMMMAVAFTFSQEMMLLGVYGFNSCLIAIALAAKFSKKYWLIMLGILVSVLLTRAFEQVSLPALTGPFVITTWLMILLVKIKHITSESRDKESSYL